MSNYAIEVENLVKTYKIGKVAKSIQAQIMSLFKPKEEGYGETFNAIDDISFKVEHGDILGIIGKNGAGKSTLLKLLSRITHPTSGRIIVNGRLASLLEVGTGFHPELTGRENVFLNGAILGMNRAEVKRKLDEIVDFSGVEKFLDTPVKHYSSGMYVRLAFSVAAHLEPEILVIDEVLAVGDSSFQAKCLGKMNDVSKQGRTVLFVSHNMSTIQNLCEEGIYLSKGKIKSTGEMQKVIENYQYDSHGLSEENQIALEDREDRSGNQQITFTDIKLLSSRNEKDEKKVFLSGDNIWIKVFYKSRVTLTEKDLRFSIGIEDSLGQILFTTPSDIIPFAFTIKPGYGSLICEIKEIALPPGRYSLRLHSGSFNTVLDDIDKVAELYIEAGDFFNTGKLIHNKEIKYYQIFNWHGK